MRLAHGCRDGGKIWIVLGSAVSVVGRKDGD